MPSAARMVEYQQTYRIEVKQKVRELKAMKRVAKRQIRRCRLLKLLSWCIPSLDKSVKAELADAKCALDTIEGMLMVMENYLLS